MPLPATPTTPYPGTRGAPAGDSFAGEGGVLAVGSREWEEAIEARCQQAGLTSRQREVVLLWAAGAPRMKIRAALGLTERDVCRALDVAAERFAVRFPEFFAAGHQFSRDLLLCVANRSLDDPRPPGVRGVSPDWETLPRYPAARMILAEDYRLRQPVDYCLRLFLRQVAAEALTT